MTIVFISAAFDKGKAVLNTFYSREQLEFTRTFEVENVILNIKRLWKGLQTDETTLSLEVIDDLTVCYNYSAKKAELYSFVINFGHNGKSTFLS